MSRKATIKKFLTHRTNLSHFELPIFDSGFSSWDKQCLMFKTHPTADFEKVASLALDFLNVTGGSKYEVHGIFFKYPEDKRLNSSWM